MPERDGNQKQPITVEVYRLPARLELSEAAWLTFGLPTPAEEAAERALVERLLADLTPEKKNA